MWVISRWFNVSLFHFIFLCLYFFSGDWKPKILHSVLVSANFCFGRCRVRPTQESRHTFSIYFRIGGKCTGLEHFAFRNCDKINSRCAIDYIIFLVFITRRATTVPFILDDNDINAQKPSWLVSFSRCRRPTPPVRQHHRSAKNKYKYFNRHKNTERKLNKWIVAAIAGRDTMDFLLLCARLLLRRLSAPPNQTDEISTMTFQ